MSRIEENLLDEITRFNEGEHQHSYRIFGNHRSTQDNKSGYRFTLWAPHAKNVYLVGDFNGWQEQKMERVFESGSWTIFREDVYPSQKYKYVIEDANGQKALKIDPFATRFEMPPQDAAIVSEIEMFEWEDGSYLENRKRKSKYESPINIYEVHKNSWMKHFDHANYTFDDLIERLIPYVKEMGYTHIELMPVMEHPLEASWGYQITGYFAVAARYGDALGLKRFINAAHKENLGIILDWVPGHFCQNLEAMAYFDGTATYEYQNSIRAYNKRWGALNFDLGKNQVHSFLISSLMYWVEEFHVDGIRVDAVSNMLYLDYDLPPHVLNEDGSNLNYEGINFLRKMNASIDERHGDVLMIAEESTNYQGLTKRLEDGGLGFDFKWNMGWMNDILRFFEMDPLYRKHQFNLVTFIFVYMHHEKYILPLSHDEVVHGKKSLLAKMPGDRYNQFAQLKVLYTLMQMLPGGTLNFMGNELGQFLEWRFYSELEWKDLDYPINKEYQHYIQTINHIILESPEIYKGSFKNDGIKVHLANDDECIIVIERIHEKDSIIAVLNFLPVERLNYEIPVGEAGLYEVFINSENQAFGGTWRSLHDDIESKENKINLTLPSYGALLIRKRRGV